MIIYHGIPKNWSFTIQPQQTPELGRNGSVTHLWMSGESTLSVLEKDQWCATANTSGLESMFETTSNLQTFWIKVKVEYPAAAAAAKTLQFCPTLCDPRNGSPPGSPVPGILQARTLEWVAISFSDAWKWKVKVRSLSRVRLFAAPWTAAYQAPPSMGFSRQEYWSGLPLPSPKNWASCF